MLDNSISFLNLGAFSTEEKDLLRSDHTYSQKESKLRRSARDAAKRETCYFCGKRVTSFCKSHSVPLFSLKHIAAGGNMLTINTAIDNPLMEYEQGSGKAGTFYLICRNCDSKIFSDYENPNNYTKIPTQKMLAQMVLKNSLKMISKRLIEIELYNILAEKNELFQPFASVKNSINDLDLNEYISSYKRAKKSLETENSSDYYIYYYEKLNYVVPLAFQSSIALALDFDGNIINDPYSTSPEYKTENIHISILPLETESVIVMFIDDGNKRYRRFHKQFNKLDSDDKLAALTFIMLAYSEDIYFSKSVENTIRNTPALCAIAKNGLDLISHGNPSNLQKIAALNESYNLGRRRDIPNLLSEEYKIL